MFLPKIKRNKSKLQCFSYKKNLYITLACFCIVNIPEDSYGYVGIVSSNFMGFLSDFDINDTPNHAIKSHPRINNKGYTRMQKQLTTLVLGKLRCSKQFITKTCPCNIQRLFSAVKIENFIGKKIDISYIFAQNIDCGYTLEPPRQFYYIKVEIKGVFIARTCFPDVKRVGVVESTAKVMSWDGHFCV